MSDYIKFVWHQISGCPLSRDMDVSAAIIVSENGQLYKDLVLDQQKLNRIQTELTKEYQIKYERDDVSVNILLVDVTCNKYTVLAGEKGPSCGNQGMLVRTAKYRPAQEAILLDLCPQNIYLKLICMFQAVWTALSHTTSVKGGTTKGFYKSTEETEKTKLATKGCLFDQVTRLLEIDFTKMFDEGIYEVKRKSKNQLAIESGKELSEKQKKREAIKLLKQSQKKEEEAKQELKPWPLTDAAKKIAFQFVQCLALLYGWDLATKLEEDLPPIPLFRNLVPIMRREIDFTKSQEQLTFLNDIKEVTCKELFKIMEMYPIMKDFKDNSFNVARNTLAIMKEGVLSEVLLPNPEKLVFWKSWTYGEYKLIGKQINDQSIYKCKNRKCQKYTKVIDAPISRTWPHSLCKDC